MYSASLVVNYSEIYHADDAWTTVIPCESLVEHWLGQRSLTNPNDVVSIEQTWNTETFYTELASRLEVNPRVRRVLGNFDSGDKARAFDFASGQPRFGHLPRCQRNDQQHRSGSADLDQHSSDQCPRCLKRRSGAVGVENHQQRSQHCLHQADHSASAGRRLDGKFELLFTESHQRLRV